MSPGVTPPRPKTGTSNAAPDADAFYTLANSLAHEIRNPLNALALNLKLLARDVAATPAEEKLSAALAEVRRLDELLTAFLRFARPKQPQFAGYDLKRVLGELEVFVSPEAVKRGVELVTVAPEGLTLATDADLLKQALMNLVLNAFEAGARRVEVAAVPRERRVDIVVTDDGPGVAEPERAAVPFYSTKEDGTGLGLPTARAIAQALGGELNIARPPRGAEITITLPIPAA